MSLDRFYKEDKGVPDSFAIDMAFVPIDSGGWRKPYIISVERIGKAIQLKIDEDAASKNVTAVKYSDMNNVPDLSPESLPVDAKTHLAVDENYLYVWVPQVKRWKRMPLTEW